MRGARILLTPHCNKLVVTVRKQGFKEVPWVFCNTGIIQFLHKYTG